MPNLADVKIPAIDTTCGATEALENEGGLVKDDSAERSVGIVEDDAMDRMAIEFVLDSVIDFLEELKLTGEPLKHAGQILRDVEALRLSL